MRGAAGCFVAVAVAGHDLEKDSGMGKGWGDEYNTGRRLE